MAVNGSWEKLGDWSVDLSNYVQVGDLANYVQTNDSRLLTPTQSTYLNDLINKNPNCNFMDVLLFTKAELLVSENRIEEAFAVFTDIKVKFPKSGLIEYVDEMLENLESKPEDIEGL